MSRLVGVCIAICLAFVLGTVGCPAPVPIGAEGEISKDASSFEQKAEQGIDIQAQETNTSEQATDASPRNDKQPEVTPDKVESDDSQGAKDCPRGQLYDTQKASCQDFPKVELQSEELTFTNAKDNVTLSGTLLKPKVEEGIRLPAIIFIHGSGPNDRDETSPGALGLQLPKPVKVFKDIAEYFAARGYIVFRYDKRTFGLKDPKKALAWTVDSFTQDASAALDMLKQRPDVKPGDLTVMGHSQGGTLVLDLAVQRKDIKSVVILAGAADPLKKLLIDQFKLIITWLEKSPPSAQRDQQLATYRAKITQYEKAIPAIEAGTYQDPNFEGVPIAFWKSWIENHKRIESNLKAITQPLAVVSGTLDFNVPPAQTKQLQTWRGSQSQDFVKVYDNVTHPLVHVAFNQAGESVYEPLLEDLLQWMNGQG